MRSLREITWTVLIAGAVATIAFDMFGQTISPLLKGFFGPFIGAKLSPVPLAQSVLAVLTGVPGKTLGGLGLPHGLHVLTGVIFYPLGWLLVVRPIWGAIVPRLHWSVPAVGYGVGLWVFALYFMAHLVAGNAAFLGWSGITWVALWAHILFAVVMAAVIEARMPLTVATNRARDVYPA